MGDWCMSPRRRGKNFYDQLIWICYYRLWHSQWNLLCIRYISPASGGSAPGPRWLTSVSQPPCFVPPLANFWLRRWPLKCGGPCSAEMIEQDSKHVCTAVPQRTHQTPRRRYATAHPAVRSHRLRKTFFRCVAPSIWNSLPASVIGSDSLSVFKSRLKHSYFVGRLTSTYHRLPPAPLKLRPYGA